MTDRGKEFIRFEFTRLLKDWYQPPEGLAPAEVQLHEGDACLVIGKVLEEFAVMQAKYKLQPSHMPQLGNVNSLQLVPGFDPGHTMGTGEQEPHNYLKAFPLAFQHLSATPYTLYYLKFTGP
ncbi:hypothetical protein DSO57_1034121 [Entomophthora muscae]|uniref:Uncharacterized protein n=1 Tax=Entomophthora muscae TaxID=34485 RepID=A0ACC2RQR8_9FUNG|nr:hypothetical protein DSO57_1034121 [Entomophthora muscae]